MRSERMSRSSPGLYYRPVHSSRCRRNRHNGAKAQTSPLYSKCLLVPLEL